MVQLTMRLHIQSAKRREFLRTAESLLTKLKEIVGCISCNFYQDFDDENIFCFVQEWNSRQDLDVYLHSNDFSVLFGAVKVLGKPVKFKVDITRGDLETVNAIRGDQG